MEPIIGRLARIYSRNLYRKFWMFTVCTCTFVPIVFLSRYQGNSQTMVLTEGSDKVINNFTFQNNDTEIAKEHTTMGKFTTTAHLNITRADIPDVKHLLDLLGDTWHTAFIKKRIQENWEDRVSAYIHIVQKNLLPLNRSKKKMLVYPGVITLTPYAKNAFKGGPLGELVQWADLICGLYMLGHTVLFELNSDKVNDIMTEQLKQAPRNDTLNKPGCHQSDIEYIYTDLDGHNIFKENIRKAFKYRFRILDSFGTEQAYNNPVYAERKGLLAQSELYGLRDLHLKQFYTLLGHTRDNSFLGFMVKDPEMLNGPVLERENISLLYGKDKHLYKASKEVDLVTPVLKKYTQVHITLPEDPKKLTSVVNHGLLRSREYIKLARRVKVIVGIGIPIEGPGLLEALAMGCVLIIPECNEKFPRKPTNRTRTSQNVYCERTIGQPHVYTVDYNNTDLLERTIRKALATKVKPYVPFELTGAGYLLKLNLLIERQTLCNDTQQWPPLSMMQVYTGNYSASCDEVCHSKGLQCENSFFKQINNHTIFAKHGLQCKSVEYIEDIYVPAYQPVDSRCILQKNPHLFSCASYLGPLPSIQRLCPCRSHTTFGKHKCEWC